MRLIFSRKGFDSSTAGYPSPIVDGRPVPLPIPATHPSSVSYGQLTGDYAAMVADLTHGRYGADTACHLDPDIDRLCLSRSEGWRGAFGQAGAALGHLMNQKVGVGDLFLFWGRYRPAAKRDGRWTFTGPAVNVLYGWLQVGQYHALGPDGSHILSDHPWLADHPHARPGWGRGNGLFVAADDLRVSGFERKAPGWGVLPQGFQLSVPGELPSAWRIPDWLNPTLGGVGMTYHSAAKCWSADGTMQCVRQGQEFVAHVGDDARVGKWLSTVMVSGPDTGGNDER